MGYLSTIKQLSLSQASDEGKQGHVLAGGKELDDISKTLKRRQNKQHSERAVFTLNLNRVNKRAYIDK
jgi:hypothetical protein